MRSDDRAVSEVVGYLLILMITIISIGVIYLVGGPLTDSLQDRVFFESMETNFIALHEDLARTSTELTPVMSTGLRLGGGTIRVGSDTEVVNVTIKIERDLHSYSQSNNYSQFIRYERKDRSIAYILGGVWIKDLNGGTITLVEPDIHIDGDQGHISLVNLNPQGDSSVDGGRVSVISDPGQVTKNFFEGINSSDLTNISIRVEGEYAPAMGHFLESENFTHDGAYYNASVVNLSYCVRNVNVHLD